MAYQITWEDHGVYVRLSGHTSDEEVAEVARVCQADVRLTDMRYSQNDFLACIGVTYSEDTVEEMAATDGAARRSNPRLRIAVVSKSSKILAMAKSYMLATFDQFPMRVFSTVEAASSWLERGTHPTR